MARYTAAMNYFSARQLIINQLKTELAAANAVCRVQAMAGWRQFLENLQPAPVMGVWHQADKVRSGDSASRNRGQRQIIDQVWTVAIAARNVSDIAGGAAQDDAAPLIAVIQTLQGWKPSAAHGHLYRVQSQFMSAYANGYGVFPFAFQTRIFT